MGGEKERKAHNSCLFVMLGIGGGGVGVGVGVLQPLHTWNFAGNLFKTEGNMVFGSIKYVTVFRGHYEGGTMKSR
jgi:hypothetical protein